MAIDEVRTYAEAARWLPRDVRQAIEITRPCTGGGEHVWEHSVIDVTNFSSGPSLLHQWRCYGCETYTDVDPGSLSA